MLFYDLFKMGISDSKTRRLPIGIFDSGIGGLTVVRAIRKLLPNEDIVYLGDTARVPYGTKSPETVKRFALEDAAFLARQNVKAIVVACNTASSWALSDLEREYDFPVMGVIEPGVKCALSMTKNYRIGVIGTNATIMSRTYTTAIKSLNKNAAVFSKPCPLLVPLVEEGWINHPVTRETLKLYLLPLLKRKIDTLILGCTHYPLLKNVIRKIIGNQIGIVDSAEACANYVRSKLCEKNLLNPIADRHGQLLAYVTDSPEHFTHLADRFLGRPIERVWKADLG